MSRKPIRKEKFYLFSRKKQQYLKRTGVFDDGSGPMKYTRWTPYYAAAQRFVSAKAAEAVRYKLEAYGDTVYVMTGVPKWGNKNV